MPPRFAYWTIIIDDAPTAFRARDRAELIGVLRQLANRNPNAVMKWFAHGKLWDSPEQERAASREAARAQREPRGPDWRPGGKHADPRARFEKRGARHRREHDKRREEAGGAGGDRPAQGPQEEQSRPPAQGYPHRRPRPERRDAKPRGRERRPWERGGDRNDRKGPGRARPTGPRVPRVSSAPRSATSETPDEPEPPAPQQPPGPERPRKPGQEPGPEKPAEETIKILPEPPERAAGPKRR